VNACYALGDHTRAILYCEQRVTVARTIRDSRGEEQALASLGVSYDALGDYTRAIQAYEQRLAVARKLRDHRLEKQVLENLKLACYVLGDYARAAEYSFQTS
jgi:tetratricopeptide (TPR) repeat protein